MLQVRLHCDGNLNPTSKPACLGGVRTVVEEFRRHGIEWKLTNSVWNGSGKGYVRIGGSKYEFEAQDTHWLIGILAPYLRGAQ